MLSEWSCAVDEPAQYEPYQLVDACIGKASIHEKFPFPVGGLPPHPEQEDGMVIDIRVFMTPASLSDGLE